MGCGKQSDLDKFIDKKCYTIMYDAMVHFVEDNPEKLELSGVSNFVIEPNAATLCDMELIKTCNAASEEDEIIFDAIVRCEIEIEETIRRNRETDGITQWFKLQCSAVLGDGLKSFHVVNIEVYSR